MRIVHRVDDGLSAAEIISLQPFAEIEYGDEVVVRRHEKAAGGTVHAHDAAALIGFTQILRLPLRNIAVDGGLGHKEALFAREVRIAVIGRVRIARIRRHKVSAARHERRLELPAGQHAADDGSALGAVTVFFVQNQRNGKIFRQFPAASHFIARIADGTGQRFQIVGRQRRDKPYLERKIRTRKGIRRFKRGNANTFLFERDRIVPPAQKTVRCSAEADQPVGAAGSPLPEDRVAAAERIVLRPDGKIGIDDPQRICG